MLAVFIGGFVFGVPVMAYQQQEAEEAASVAGTASLADEAYFTPEEAAGDAPIDIFSKTATILREALESAFSPAGKLFFALLASLLLAAASSLMQFSESLHGAVGFATLLVLAGVCFSGLSSAFSYAAEALQQLHTFMTALLPVTATLMSLGGNISAGVAGSSALLFFLAIVGQVSTDVLYPLLASGFVLSIAEALPPGNLLRSVTVFFKNACTTLMAFVFTMFGVVMYFQTAVTAAADSYAFRAVRFASGVFIPVIGNMIGDAARTVASAVGVVRGTVGAIGVVTVLALVLPPLVLTVCYKLAVLGAAMVSRMLGLERESAFLYDVNAVMSILVALVAGVGTVFVIAVGIFIRIGVGN